MYLIYCATFSGFLFQIVDDIDVIVQNSTSPQLVLSTEKTVFIVGGKHLICEFSTDICWGQVLHTLISTYYACLLTYPRNEKDFITMAGFLSLLQLRVLGCNVEKHDKTKHFKDLEKKVEAYINP